MQRQVFNNHPTERIVPTLFFFSIYSVPLGCPYVLLCRPLESLSVIVMDLVFLCCALWFEMATSVSVLVALLACISRIRCILIANPIHGNHPNLQHLSHFNSHIHSGQFSGRSAAFSPQTRGWQTIKYLWRCWRCLCATVSLVSFLSYPATGIRLGFRNKHAHVELQCKNDVQRSARGNLSITRSYFPIIGCK